MTALINAAAILGQATRPTMEPWPAWSGFVLGGLGALLIELLRLYQMFGKMSASRFTVALRSPKLYVLAGILVTVGSAVAGIFDLDQRRSGLPSEAFPGPFQLLMFGAGAPAILRQGIASAVAKRDRHFGGTIQPSERAETWPANDLTPTTFTELLT